MENPEISGVEYPQGELLGWEVREDLLEKWSGKCDYCEKEGVLLQVEHIHPKAKGGTNPIFNRCLGCEQCNIKKGAKPIEQFLAKKPEVLQRIQKSCQTPPERCSRGQLDSVGIVRSVKKTGLPVRTGTGGQAKYNRIRYGFLPVDMLLS